MMRLALASLALSLPLAASGYAASPVPSNGVINQPGDYYLSGNVTIASGAAIQINAQDVDLDLRGRYVICAPLYPSSAVTFGVLLSGKSHVTIRNGGIWGCYAGISGAGDSLRLTGLDLSYQTYMGANVSGSGIKVSDCVFQGIGGYTADQPYAVGIQLQGNAYLIERNTFREIKRQNMPASLGAEGVGILIKDNSRNGVIRSNWMANGAPGAEIGMWFADGAQAFVAENSITNFGEAAIRGNVADGTVENNRLLMSVASPGSIGVRRADGPPTIEARGNVISGFERALVNVTDLGNQILP